MLALTIYLAAAQRTTPSFLNAFPAARSTAWVTDSSTALIDVVAIVEPSGPVQIDQRQALGNDSEGRPESFWSAPFNVIESRGLNGHKVGITVHSASKGPQSISLPQQRYLLLGTSGTDGKLRSTFWHLSRPDLTPPPEIQFFDGSWENEVYGFSLIPTKAETVGNAMGTIDGLVDQVLAAMDQGSQESVHYSWLTLNSLLSRSVEPTTTRATGRHNGATRKIKQVAETLELTARVELQRLLVRLQIEGEVRPFLETVAALPPDFKGRTSEWNPTRLSYDITLENYKETQVLLQKIATKTRNQDILVFSLYALSNPPVEETRKISEWLVDPVAEKETRMRILMWLNMTYPGTPKIDWPSGEGMEEAIAYWKTRLDLKPPLR